MDKEVVGITTALNFFSQAIDQGRGVLLEDAQSLFQLLVILEVVLAGIYMAIGGGADLRGVAKKILAIGFLSWVIANYDYLLKVVLDGFLYAGQKASGSTGADLTVLTSPGQLFVDGCKIITPVFTKLAAYSYFSFPVVDGVITILCGLVGCLCFGVISIQIFVTYIEFLIVSSLGFILIPFGIFKPTAYLSEKVFGAIISFGIKFMVLSFVVALAHQFMPKLSMPEEVSWQNALDFMVISLALAFLAFHAPSVALSLLSGTPHLSAGTVAATYAGSKLAGKEGLSASASIGGGTVLGLTRLGGAAAGGAVAALASSAAKAASMGGAGSSQGADAGSQKSSSSLSSIAGKVATGARGALAGAASGTLNSISEYAKHGATGAPDGSKNARIAAGLSPSQGGIMGAVNRGKYSVPAYRKHAAGKKKEDEKQEVNARVSAAENGSGSSHDKKGSANSKDKDFSRN